MRKIIFLSFGVLLLAAGCQNVQNSKPLAPRAEVAPAQKNQPVSKAAPVKAPSADVNIEQPARQQIQVVQKVEGEFGDKLFNFYADENKTALDLLKTSYKIDTKSFSGVGEFVEAIDGVKPDKKHFWEFVVNGQSSNVGASSYLPQNGDKIEWKLTEIH